MVTVSKLLDRLLRLQPLIVQLDLPDTPETRKLLRLAWCNGFTLGLLKRRVAAARAEARSAVDRASSPHNSPISLEQ